MSTLNFSKTVEANTSLNFSKLAAEVGVALTNDITFSVKWGNATDLDAWAMCASTGGAPREIREEVVTKKAGFIGRMFGAKDQTEVKTSTIGGHGKGIIDKIYTNLLPGGKLRNAYINHSGDDLGSSRGSAEAIKINLSNVDPKVDEIYLGLTNFSRGTLDDVPSIGIDIKSGNKGLVTYAAGQVSGKSIVLAKIVRTVSGEWELMTMDKSTSDRSMSDIARMCERLIGQ